MSKINKVADLKEKKYYWSPAVEWEQKEDELRIEKFFYDDSVQDLFPDFYFHTQGGILIGDLINKFPQHDDKMIISFVKDLIKKRILVDSILSPQEIFYPQARLFENEYSKEIKYNEDKLEKFKEKQLQRTVETPTNNQIKLQSDCKFPSYISDRVSYREFNTEQKIDFNTFSKLLSTFKQRKTEDEIRYYYASAGGLYPIDVYLYVKEDRVENVKEGLYYYNPVDNSLELIDGKCKITSESHYFTNKQIFKESAFSLFLIYNAEVTMPKYEGMGYFYACLDTGIMVSTLTTMAELNKVGICSIGDMYFNKIKKYFKLNDDQIHLHTVEVGLQPNLD